MQRPLRRPAVEARADARPVVMPKSERAVPAAPRHADLPASAPSAEAEPAVVEKPAPDVKRPMEEPPPRDDAWRGRNRTRAPGSWSSLVLMALAVLGLTFVAWLYQTDQKAVEDEDLRLATPPDLTSVITSPSRLEVFLDSVQPAPGAGLQAGSIWDWETGVMAQWLVQNGQALDNLKDLLEDSDWHGRHASWHLKDLGSHPNWATAALLKQVESAYMQRRGEDEAALAALLDLTELARRLQDILAWPSFYLRSLDMHRRGTEALAELLPRCASTEEILASVQRQFDACAPRDTQTRDDVLPAIYLHEKKLLLGTSSGLAHDTMPAGVQRPRPKQLFFKTNETLDIMANTIRYLTRQVGQQSASSLALRDAWVAVPGLEARAYYQPNGAGAAYAAARMGLYLDIPARQQLARARHLLVLQLFAMRRFVLQEKGLPASLDGLKPRYLSELPRDPFSGEAFHYDTTRGLIFSAGSDLQPQGGRPDLPPLADPGEPTVKIGVRMAAGR